MYILIISSLIYSAIFFYPEYIGCFTFIMLIPLIVYDRNNRFHSYHGLVFGLIYFALHFYWFACTVRLYGQGDYRMLLYIGTVLYFTVFASLWFWLKYYIYQLIFSFLQQESAARAIAWSFSTVVFWYVTCYCSFALFDCFEGYPFINPLLPLLSFPLLVQPVTFMGQVWYWAVIVCIQASIACYFTDFIAWILLCVICLQMYVWTCLNPLPSLSVFNFYEYKCAYIQPSWTALSIPEQFYAIQKELDHLAVHYEDLDYIFMPEGAYPHNLAAVADKLEAFDSLWVHKPLIILGAHRCGADTYNSAYCIRDGRIIHSYDKQHLVFFVERLPLIMRLLQHTTSAFMPEHGFFTYPDEQQQDEIDGFQLYICSELFFKFKHPGGKPIIFLCYDAWFSCDYLQKLVYYDVQLYSIQYQVPIIYIGHAGCAIFYP